jgi:hypothetical protein
VGAGLTSAAIEYLGTPELSTETAVNALQQGLADGSRGSSIEISLLAPDAASYEKISVDTRMIVIGPVVTIL